MTSTRNEGLRYLLKKLNWRPLNLRLQKRLRLLKSPSRQFRDQLRPLLVCNFNMIASILQKYGMFSDGLGPRVTPKRTRILEKLLLSIS